MENLLDNFNEWLDSPEGKEAFYEFNNSLEMVNNLNQKYINIIRNYVNKLSDEDLDEQFQKIFNWENKFDNIISSNLLSYIHLTWVDLGQTIDLIDKPNKSGANYRNYTIGFICEERCTIVVYKNNQLIFQTK